MDNNSPRVKVRQDTKSSRPRIRWTPELNHLFLEAVQNLGGKYKATPKQIMQMMGVEGLKTSHIRNHLQVSRIMGKRIVDDKTATLGSNLASFAKNVNVSDAVSENGKDITPERRQGFGLARKRAPFALKTSLSQPVSLLEPSLDIDKLQDPDECFDAYERLGKAKKELQKQLGNSMDNVNEFKPSTKPRLPRQGILGMSYHYRHRYPSVSFENDMFMSSQEEVKQHVPSVPRDELVEMLTTHFYKLNVDSEEIESVGEQVNWTTLLRVSSELDSQKVLGCLDNLPHQFIQKNSSMESEKAGSGPVEAPEYNNIEKTINVAQSNDMRPLEYGKGEKNVAGHLNDAEQVNWTNLLRVSSELESHIGVEVIEPTDSNMDPQKVLGCSDNLPHQFIDKNSSMESEKAGSGPVEAAEYINVEETINVAQSNDNQSNLSACEDEATQAQSTDGQHDAEEQFEVHQTKPRRRKRETDDERPRKLHSLRKSLAGDATGSGTSFDNGVRRSKRFKMRPLEFWKGERFLYGRVNGRTKELENESNIQWSTKMLHEFVSSTWSEAKKPLIIIPL